VATPLLAATGETVTERAGVINLGIEGMMLAGALAAALGATAAGPWTGVALAVLAGMALAALFAAVAIGARGDQIITGTAVTLGAVGLTGTVYRQAYGAGGLDVPPPPRSRCRCCRTSRCWAPLSLASRWRPISRSRSVVWWGLFRTQGGLALRPPAAAAGAAAGVRPRLARTVATTIRRIAGRPGPRWCSRRLGPSPNG
jgi:simple sugar transport system permease protein